MIEYKYQLPNEIEFVQSQQQNDYYCNYNYEELILKYRGHYFTENKNNNNNQSYLCQKNCAFIEYNSSINSLTCQCPIYASGDNIYVGENNKCLIKLDNQNINDNNEVYNLIQDNILQSFSPEKGTDQFIEGLENIIVKDSSIQ